MIDLELEGKVAIVTGASRGLGRTAAIALAEQGAQILAAARSADELARLEDSHPTRIRAYPCDMLDTSTLTDLPQQAIRDFGRLDIVVNNAGIAPAGPFLEQTDSEWNRIMAVNIAAPAILSRAAGHIFSSQGSGKVINIASTSGLLGKAQLVAYSASKGAMIQFTKALAAEWAKLGIQVNAIAPGAFETDAQRAVLESPETFARRVRKIPARRMGEAEEIGPLVCYLASSKANFVTGAVFVIDGGEASRL